MLSLPPRVWVTFTALLCLAGPHTAFATPAVVRDGTAATVPDRNRAAPLPGSDDEEPEPALAPRDISGLFSDELQEANAKLKWHGERLSDDTIYAAALTGASWETAWGREHLFSLVSPDTHRKPEPRRKTSSRNGAKGSREDDFLVTSELIRQAYDRHDYNQVISLATAHFSVDEIAADLNLKECVGGSLLAVGQPQRAFPIFASPFAPTPALLADDARGLTEANRHVREWAWETAQRAGLRKEAIAFALSLLLEPGTTPPTMNQNALRFLTEQGVDIDRVLLGVLESPEKLHGLPAYYYAAADLLAGRATPRLLPFLLHLANSDDVYLRSRALMGLGIIAYTLRPNDPPGWAGRLVAMPLRTFGISASERTLIDQEIREAIASDKYRLRVAGALALALVGGDDAVPTLQKLARDKAYLLPDAGEKGGGRDRPHRIVFPVRLAASAALARWNVRVGNDSTAPLDGKAFDLARRGNQDMTTDRRGLRRDVASEIPLSPLDVAIGTTGDNRLR